LGSRSCGDANILETQVFSGAYERDWGMNDPYLLFIINGEMMGIYGNIWEYMGIYIYSPKSIILSGEWGICLIIHFP
jgi:hypothetical protein